MTRHTPRTINASRGIDERFVARARGWLPTHASGPVVLDPARWSERGRQVAFWCLCEAWLADRRVH